MVKSRTTALLCALALLAGLLSGLVLSLFLPDGLLNPAVLTGAAAIVTAASSDETDNVSLVTRAMSTLTAIESRDYAALSAQVDPERGVTFTPLATVDPVSNLTFSPEEIASAGSSERTYIWGMTTDTAEPISLTISGYFDAYVWDVDYTTASEINIDRVQASGNALENVAEAYPDCRFVEFYSAGVRESTDWQALKLVYRWTGGNWYLTGVIHSTWTA